MADLVGRPRGRRVPGHVDMQDLASVMGQHDEHKQHPKCKRWDHEEVDRDELADVIRQEGAPGLGRRGPTTHHVVPNRGFSDRDAELEQLAVDARGAPGRVGAAHLADEFLNGARDAGPPGPTRPTLPAPVEPKASSMPAEDRVGLDDDERVPPTGPQVTEPRPEHPVDWPQPRSPSSLSLQDRQLMAQRGVLDLKRRLAPQARPERGEQHETHGSHGPGGYQADARSSMYRPRTRFPVGTAVHFYYRWVHSSITSSGFAG